MLIWEMMHMRVKVANKLYKMNSDEYKGLLAIASEQVPFGIYAIEKKDYAELRADHCKSITWIIDSISGFCRRAVYIR